MGIKDFLNQEGIGFYTNDEGEIVIDCSGCDFEFLKTANILIEQLEEWTYENLWALKIEINTAYETITIKGEI